jgi:fatty-acid desaturase
LKWYQFDMNWITVRLLQRLGLARDIRIARVTVEQTT